VDFDRKEASTGFLFEEASAEGLASAMARALSIYPDRAAWKGLQLRGMGQDFSWERSAREFLNLYETLLRNPHSS
jgi:starch synthase